MNESLFVKWVATFFAPLVATLTERINGAKGPLSYLHKSMLTKEFSPTLKWSSIGVNGSVIAADLVALDSELPLKKRDSMTKVTGDIPKMGMKLFLSESTLNDLNIMRQQPNMDSQIAAKLFADTKKVMEGIYERLEYMFLQGLSSGVTLIDDTDKPGVGIRIDYGYKNANKYATSGAVWSASSGATPIADLEAVLTAASTNGDVITTVIMDRFAWNNFKKSSEVKALYAASIGFAGATVPTPTITQVNDAMQQNYGITIKIVDRSIKTQVNGVDTASKPWTEGAVVFLTTEKVGRLAWGYTAEKFNQAKQVTYAEADDFILVSKYHKNDPIREFTSSQAVVVPVIDGVESIYLLDSKTAQG
ncbi:major capsid protein [Aquirufa nivalisilvae]|uniref:major capsid protein n=1 Tax=Aquirufa nivalisilvae TaxID=2516557 RepID=UPI0022A8ED4A|nr:major capsid protein [Aquirufa nivalisilvae]MCZ2480012.1 hypothetical protein [Aquirufa nivalisilvae]